MINRSLPTISYMTSLDKYAMFSIIFLVFLCIWHSIIDSDILPGDLDDFLMYDRYALISFAGLFALLHLYLVVWLILGYRKVKRIRKALQKLLR